MVPFISHSGLNKQWGTNTIGSRTTRTEAYPLPYSEFCLPIVSGKGYVGGLNYGFGVGVTNFGLTSVTIANNSEDSSYRWTGYTYIVVGAQPQWGYYVESQNPTDYRYWSIPFTSHYITMATKTYYEPKEEAVPWLVGIDMQKFICGYGANFIGSSYVSCVGIGCQPQWGYYTAAVGAIYTDVTTPVSFSRCFFAASIDILLAASTTWPGTTQTVWNINASTANKLRFIWAKAPIELDGAVWFGIFIQTVGIW